MNTFWCWISLFILKVTVVHRFKSDFYVVNVLTQAIALHAGDGDFFKLSHEGDLLCKFSTQIIALRCRQQLLTLSIAFVFK